MNRWWKKYWWHCALWTSLVVAQLVQDYVAYSSLINDIGWGQEFFWIGIVVSGGIVSVYGYGYILSLFNWRKHVFPFIGVTLAFIFVFPLWQGIWRSYLSNLFFDNSIPSISQLTHFSFIFFTSITRGWAFVGLGFVIAFYNDYLNSQRQKQLFEKTALSAELDSLKNQINPHFLYNTLSYLYAQARPLSPQLSESILILSDMMRYSLHQTDEQGLVSLEKEIEHINNYIQIHQLRFDNKLAVNFSSEGNLAHKRILPLVLISFVENAFKHGKLGDPNHPITIELRVGNDSSLWFNIKNRKSEGPKEHSSGIGLQNVRRRLELVYPNQHQLHISNTNALFEVSLSIKKV